MKVLVTGGAGYLGTELVRLLSHRSDLEEVVVYDNLSRRQHSLFLAGTLGPVPVRVAIADLLDTRSLKRELERVDFVVHLAASVTTPFADVGFHALEQVNHWGTAELGYLLEEHPVQGLVYVSSCSVYGDQDGVIELGAPVQPDSAYALSKYRGERMLERLQGRMPVAVVRCGNVYGYSEAMRFDAVINRFVFDAHFRGRIQVHGSGEQRRAFVPVDKAVGALARLVRPALTADCYHLVERNLAIGEVAVALRELDPDVEMIFTEQDMRRRSLQVAPDPRLLDGPDNPLEGFVDQLRAFQQQLAFRPVR